MMLGTSIDLDREAKLLRSQCRTSNYFDALMHPNMAVSKVFTAVSTARLQATTKPPNKLSIPKLFIQQAAILRFSIQILKK